MLSDDSKNLAERVKMLHNLLNHIDDYINNKKERKGQLRLPKSIRLVLREVISSKINLNYFINKEELDTHTTEPQNEEVNQKEKEYIQKINPISFNQKNLETINLFYNTNNEKYIINYLSVDKIFTIIQYCFNQLMRQKKLELKKKYEKENKDFALYNIEKKNLSKNNINFIANNANNKKQNIHNNTLNKILINKNVRNKCYNPIYHDYTNERRMIIKDLNKPNNFMKNNNYKLNNIRVILYK
jgi:hypothetical protein